jgi:hypothetical protein
MGNLYYDIIEKSLDAELIDDATSLIGDGNYFILQHAPAGANVRIRLNNNLNPQIHLKENSGFEAKNTKKIYISANAVPGEKLIIIHSKTSEDFRYIPPVELNDKVNIGTVDEIMSFNNNALLNVNVTNASQIGGAEMNFENLYANYDCIASFANNSIWDDSNIEDYIGLALGHIQKDTSYVDWSLFDYVYINFVVDCNNNNPEKPYCSYVFSSRSYATTQFANNSIICIDYIDNNIGSKAGQVMTKILHKDTIKRFSDIGTPLYLYTRGNGSYDSVYISISLYKKRIPNETLFNVEDILTFTNEQKSQQLYLDINPQDEKYKGFASVKISYTIAYSDREIDYSFGFAILAATNLRLEKKFYINNIGEMELKIEYSNYYNNSPFNFFVYTTNDSLEYSITMKNINFVVSYV